MKTSKNSSVPPSQEQKVNRNGQKKAKRGAKKGHRGTSRRVVSQMKSSNVVCLNAKPVVQIYRTCFNM
ncbi:MAG: hypothetical protein Q9P01_09275 [Anaerolineae bacterium]|nr:hypothetical protein [Anaerolineae bacterium]